MRKIISTNAEEVTNGAVGPGTLYIGSGGDLKCTLMGMADGTFVTYKNLPDAYDFPRVVKYIDASSTVSDLVIDKL
jgi:hypothetical protein